MTILPQKPRLDYLRQSEGSNVRDHKVLVGAANYQPAPAGVDSLTSLNFCAPWPPALLDRRLRLSWSQIGQPSTAEVVRDRGARVYLYRVVPRDDEIPVVFWSSNQAQLVNSPAQRTQISVDFNDYLNRLASRPTFSNRVVTNTVQNFVSELYLQLSDAQIPDPQALPTSEGGLMLDWRIGIYHFEIEVYSTGLADWFWRDTNTNEYGGEDGLHLSPLPDALTNRFRDALRNE